MKRVFPLFYFKRKVLSVVRAEVHDGVFVFVLLQEAKCRFHDISVLVRVSFRGHLPSNQAALCIKSLSEFLDSRPIIGAVNIRESRSKEWRQKRLIKPGGCQTNYGYA